jgi:hypothetical protein
MLTALSILLIVVTMPFSLCLCIKVGENWLQAGVNVMITISGDFLKNRLFIKNQFYDFFSFWLNSFTYYPFS